MSSQATIMKKRRLLASATMLALALGASGCGNRAADKAAEQGPAAEVPAATDAGAAPGVDTGTANAPAGSSGAAGSEATAGDAGVAGTAPGAGDTAPGTGTSGGTKPGAQAPGDTKAAGKKGAPAAPAAGGINIAGPDSQGVTATTIKLGVIAPLSGAAGFLGEDEVGGIRAYTSMINAQGGVKGRTYTTVIADSQFEPSLEAQAARKLVEQDKVFALFSVIGDSPAPYVTAKGIPMMVFALTPAAFSSRYPTTHVTGFSTMDSVVRMAYTLKTILKKPINTTSILYDSSNINIARWVKYLSAAWKALGVEVKSTDAFNVSDGDCTPLVLKVQNLKIDFWQNAQSLAWPACGAAMGRQGYQPPQGFGGPYTADQKYVAQGGSIGMNGVYGQQVGVQILQSFGQPYLSSAKTAPATQAFVDSMKKFSPSTSNIYSLEAVWAQTFWAGAKSLHEAISAQTGAITWKGVNQWYWGQKAWDSGLTSPISFDPKCKTGSPTWIFQWKWNAAKQRFEQTPWKSYGGVVKLPDSYLNKIVPGAGQCYLTKAADNEL